MFESRSGNLPLVKHACGERDCLLCWHYTLAKVLHQRWISGNIYHTHLHSLNKAVHSGFETQRRCHQKSKTGVSVAPQMKMCPTNFFLKKSMNVHFYSWKYLLFCVLTLVAMSSSFSASLYQQILDICTVIVNQIIQTSKNIFCK